MRKFLKEWLSRSVDIAWMFVCVLLSSAFSTYIFMNERREANREQREEKLIADVQELTILVKSQEAWKSGVDEEIDIEHWDRLERMGAFPLVSYPVTHAPDMRDIDAGVPKIEIEAVLNPIKKFCESLSDGGVCDGDEEEANDCAH